MNIEQQIIRINKYSRPGTKLDDHLAIVVHWTADPGASAKNVRDYFHNMEKMNPPRYASAHYNIDFNRDQIIQCIPEDEVAHHAGGDTYTEEAKILFMGKNPNRYTIGIEVCIPDDTGEFTDIAKTNLILLVLYLKNKYSISNVLRHHDVTGKNCPKYYVQNPDEWEKLKERF